MRKKLISLICCISMIMGMTVIADAKEETSQLEEVIEFSDLKIITREEYISDYAKKHNITYEEADNIDKTLNAQIWNDYCEKNGLVQPRTLIYDDYYTSADAKIWYVRSEKKYSDGITTLTYGAQGKVIVDAVSKTFVINSFNGNGYINPHSGMITIASGYSIYIDNSSYTRLYIKVVCTVEIAVSNTASFGTSAAFVNAGYSNTTNSYWRKQVTASITETF